MANGSHALRNGLTAFQKPDFGNGIKGKQVLCRQLVRDLWTPWQHGRPKNRVDEGHPSGTFGLHPNEMAQISAAYAGLLLELTYAMRRITGVKIADVSKHRSSCI
jgi:hypothetical protein